MKETLKLALEALKKLWLLGDHAGAVANPAIKALEEALAKREQGEPVARLKGIDEYGPMLEWYKHWTVFPLGTKFYTTPQPKQKQDEPVAVVDANDDGYWAEILPDRSVKVGQLLYTTQPQPKQEQGEPVAEVFQDGPNAEGIMFLPAGLNLKVGDKLYTTPQQRTWVGLTDEQVTHLWAHIPEPSLRKALTVFAQAIEDKLKEKNT